MAQKRPEKMAKTAIISVSDKTGISEFAKELQKLGIKIISTGNTYKLLKENKINAVQVSDVTKFPEMLDGRVKSLHPNIFAGVLADRSKKSHLSDLKKLKINGIDLVVVNFYPFEESARKKAPMSEMIEKIDIGGPSLVRAAAKNHRDVLVVVDPRDYGHVLKLLMMKKIPAVERQRLASKAFSVTARYDTIIGRYFSEKILCEEFPEIYNFTFTKLQDLRYGENPHQKAAFYRSFLVNEACVSISKQLHGKELSYNNILDSNDAFELIKDFERPTGAIIKHTNPSGVASAGSIFDAYKKAYETDPKSAFGSVVALNRNCTGEIAELMKPLFVEVIICPGFEKEALEILKGKKNLRLLETGKITKDYKSPDLRRVVGGLLVQTRQTPELEEKNLRAVTKRKPNKDEMEGLHFAWKVCKHVKSNSIVFAKNEVTVGIGAGQMSRVDAVELAIKKSEGRCNGAVMSSDAFFPFRDGIDAAAKSGITAIIQPGGSVRDEEVIKAADEHNIAMVFTGIRLFKH